MIYLCYKCLGLGLHSNPLAFIKFPGKARLSVLGFQYRISMISVGYKFYGLGLHDDQFEFTKFPGKANLRLLSFQKNEFQ